MGARRGINKRKAENKKKEGIAPEAEGVAVHQDGHAGEGLPGDKTGRKRGTKERATGTASRLARGRHGCSWFVPWDRCSIKG